jgi:hypothetical protein
LESSGNAVPGKLRSARATVGCVVALLLASCGRMRDGEAHAAPDPEREAVLLQLARLRESAPAALPEPLDLAAIQEYTVEPLLLATRRNRIKGHDISKVCADLIDEVETFAVPGRVREVSEIRWVVYGGKRVRAEVPAAASSVFCDEKNVYVQASSANVESDMVYRFSRDARFLDAMRISTSGMRSGDSAGSVVAMSIDEERLILLWSAATECVTAADPACRAYSVRWAPGQAPQLNP